MTAATSEDAELAARCRAGDLAGYERLYARHGARMKNVARNLLGNAIDAEDAVQETFLKVQRSIASFRGQSSFVPWTYRILINTCYDARRSRLRKKEVANDEAKICRGRSCARRERIPPSDGAGTGAGELDQASARRFCFTKSKAFITRKSPGCLTSRRPLRRTALFQAKRNLRQV